jgi:pre-mRNA-splicing helicase BRR2
VSFLFRFIPSIPDVDLSCFSNRLLAVKKVTVQRKLAVKLDFTLPKAGKYDLQLLFVSDSYTHVDQEHKLDSITVKEAEDSDDDDDDDDDEMEQD